MKHQLVIFLNQKDLRNRKQELRERQWGYQRLIPFSSIIKAHQARVKDRYEIADFLNVTEEFLQFAVDRYRDKYGLFAVYNEKYIICFDPLGVIELFD